MDDFCAARTGEIPALLWSNFAPPYTLSSHYKEDQSAFEEKIMAMPDVLECHLISGEFDYLIRVAVSNPSDYEDFYRNRLSQIPSVAQVKTLLSLSTLKEFRGYNLDTILN